MTARYFRSAAAFRAWLQAHHATRRELLLGFHKRASGTPGITYREALDAALAFGWIDGVRRRVDEGRYTIRFTPRTRNSIWSAVNIKRVKELVKLGAMAPEGLAVFRGRNPARAVKYAYENRPRTLSGAHARIFKANPPAWTFFTAQTPSYQRVATWFVVSAVKEETRLKRLRMLIEQSARGLRIDEVSPGRRKYG